MKKAIVALIAMLMLCTPIALAQETDDVADAGTTPDSAMYGLDKAFEKIGLALTFGKAAKAQKRLQIANERMAELQAMVQKGKPEYTDDLMKERDKNIDEAIQDAEAEEAKGKDMSQIRAHVMEMQQKHIQVLQRVMEKAPEQAKQALQRNIERAQQKQQTTMRAMEQKGPQAMGKPDETGKQMQEKEQAQMGQQGGQGEGYQTMTQNKGAEQNIQTQAGYETQTQAQSGNGQAGVQAQTQQQTQTENAVQTGKQK